MRRILPAVVLLAFLLPGSPAAAPPAAGRAGGPSAGWPPLPPGTRTLLLVTGADLGHWEPRKCFNRNGGILYRLGLDQWLFEHAPAVDWHWIAAGDVLSLTLENTAVRPPREIYEGLSRIGYDVVGVGWRDLQLLGPFSIRAMTRDLPLHLVATNLRVHETGRPFLEESAVIETASGRIGILVLLPWHSDAAWISPEYGTVTIVPPEDVFADALERLRDRADRVVVVAHLGRSALERLLAGTRDMLFVAGAKGTYGRQEPDSVGDVPLLWTGGYGQLLGRACLGPGGELLELRGIEVKDTFPIDPESGRPLEGSPDH